MRSLILPPAYPRMLRPGLHAYSSAPNGLLPAVQHVRRREDGGVVVTLRDVRAAQAGRALPNPEPTPAPPARPCVRPPPRA